MPQSKGYASRKKKGVATLSELQGFFGKSRTSKAKPRPKAKPMLLDGRTGKKRAIRGLVRGGKGKSVSKPSATPLKDANKKTVAPKAMPKKKRQNRFLDKQGFKKQTRVDK